MRTSLNGARRLGREAFAIAALLLAFAASGARADTVVTINTGQIFRGLDPAKVSDQTDFMAAVNLYQPLIQVAEDSSLAPDLAESWTVSPDAREIVFKLRRDAKFADGTPVTGADVVYSFERLLKINQGPANLVSGVLAPGAVTAIDENTVKFSLSKTFAPFLATLPSIYIVNAKLVRANAGADDGQTWLADHAAGSGAYRVAKYDRGAGLTLKRDKGYCGGFKPAPIDEIRWVVTNDEATVKSMAASGELTMTSPFQAPDTYKALGGMGRFQVVKTHTATGFYLKLNGKTAPTDDVHIRRALALATDYETIRDQVFPGGPLNGPLPGAFSASYADDLKPPGFDLAAAKAEIAKSKYAGQKIPITLAYVVNTKFEEEISLLMQSNLEQIGFVVTQQADPWNRITELAAKPETTPAVTQIFFGPTYPSPDSMFFSQYDSKCAGAWASMEWLQDPEVDALIEAGRGAGDPAKQSEIYKSLQRKIVDLQPDVFLLTLDAQIAVDKCLAGFAYVPMLAAPYDFRRYSWTCP